MEINGRVFVVQEPKKRDQGTGRMVPAINLTPASAYGDIEVLLEFKDIALTPAVMIATLKRKLAGFNDADYLVLVGDPVAMGAAIGVALKENHGRAQLLKWIRNTGAYIKIQLEV